MRDASSGWILKSTGLKGSHNVIWPTPSSFPTPSLTAGLTELGKALFDDDQRGRRRAVESGDLEKYRKFLKEACLLVYVFLFVRNTRKETLEETSRCG